MTREARETSLREPQLRMLQLQVRADGTIEASLSSEEPYRRWWGVEILDHSAAAVNLKRAKDGLPLLFGHDPYSEQALIGRIRNLRVQDRRLKGDLSFFSTDDAQAVATKVREGHREMSVGYSIDEYVLESMVDDVETYRITAWTPFEGSIVSVPADFTVGVGRSRNHPLAARPVAASTEERSMADENTTMTPPAPAPATPPAAPAQPENRAANEANVLMLERDRQRQIRALGARFDQAALAEQACQDGMTLDTFRAQVLERIERKPVPVPAPAPQGGQPYGSGARSQFRYKRLDPVWGQGEAGEARAYRAGMWAFAVLLNDTRAAEWCRNNGIDIQLRAMGEATGAQGGFLVPIELEQAVIDLRDDYGIANRIARVRPMGTDQRNIPRKTGRPTAYFTDFDTTWTESEQTWGNVLLSAKRLACATRIDTDLAEDAVIDVASDVASDFAWAFAKKEDECLLIGDGTQGYAGIQGFNAKFEGTAYKSRIATASGHDTFAEIDATDLATVLAGVAAFGKRGAVWVCSQEFKAMTFDRLAVAAGGNTMSILGGAPAESYLGYPILTSQAMPSDPAADLTAKVMALFGNFQMAASLGRRRGIAVQVLRELYAQKGQIGIIASERIDAVVHDIGDTNTKGPVAAMYGNT